MDLRLELIVDDIVAARDELAEHGAAVRVPGPQPERASYGSFLSFGDTEGNGWIVQEITTRLPGR